MGFIYHICVFGRQKDTLNQNRRRAGGQFDGNFTPTSDGQGMEDILIMVCIFGFTNLSGSLVSIKYEKIEFSSPAALFFRLL